MKRKKLPVKIKYYDPGHYSTRLESQASDMMKPDRYLYVLPNVDDCIEAKRVISVFKKLYHLRLHLVDAFSHEELNYQAIEEVSYFGYDKYDHVVVIANEYHITESMLRKYIGWNIIFYSFPDINGEERLRMSPFSKKILNKLFDVQTITRTNKRVEYIAKFSRTSIIRDGFAAPLIRLQ